MLIPDGYSSFDGNAIVECNECRCAVSLRSRGKHERWHATTDAIIRGLVGRLETLEENSDVLLA